MRVELISQPLFHYSGMAKQEVAPDITQKSHGGGNEQDGQAVLEETGRCGGLKGEGVYGPFDNQGDQKLEKIHQQEAEKPESNSPHVLDEILF